MVVSKAINSSSVVIYLILFLVDNGNFKSFTWTPENMSKVTMENVNKVSKAFAAQLAQNPDVIKKKGGVIMTFSNDGSCSAKLFEGEEGDPNAPVGKTKSYY